MVCSFRASTSSKSIRNDWEKLQRALKYSARNPGRNVTLADLAGETEQSPFHAHRMLRGLLGQTPKHFTLRLRVDRAAAALVSTRISILEIALACGFESHEAFCRAFRRRYRMSPSAYRKRGLIGPMEQHAGLVNQIGPCIGLYHIDGREKGTQTMEYSISRQDLTAQPVFVIRRRVRRDQIAATIAAELPKVFLYAQQQGIAISGQPLTRYPEAGVGSVTMETGLAVAGHKGERSAAEGNGDVLAETLPGGPAAVTIHSGPYDQLHAAYAALEEWIGEQGLHPGGAPWEVYLTDPADYPNPQDWKTQVCWPIADSATLK